MLLEEAKAEAEKDKEMVDSVVARIAAEDDREVRQTNDVDESATLTAQNGKTWFVMEWSSEMAEHVGQTCANCDTTCVPMLAHLAHTNLPQVNFCAQARYSGVV